MIRVDLTAAPEKGCKAVGAPGQAQNNLTPRAAHQAGNTRAVGQDRADPVLTDESAFARKTCPANSSMNVSSAAQSYTHGPGWYRLTLPSFSILAS
jgi:hypothetical protein